MTADTFEEATRRAASGEANPELAWQEAFARWVRALAAVDKERTPGNVAEAMAAEGAWRAADERLRRPKGEGPKRLRLADTLPGSLRHLQRRADKEELPVPTPWRCVNRELGGGLWPGLHVLVGATGAGKSQWALQIALHAAENGAHVCYVGLELDQTGHDARLLGLKSGQKWSALYLGEGDGTQLAEANRFAGGLSDLPYSCELAAPNGWPYGRLGTLARELRAEADADTRPVLTPDGTSAAAKPGTRPVLIVVDYLQLVTGPEGEDSRLRVGRAAFAARAAAREYGATVLLLSSTARENYGTVTGEAAKKGAPAALPFGEGNPGRLVGLGKESGEIEFTGDTALVLAQDQWPDGKRPVGGSTSWIAVAKIRARPHGATGWARLTFNGSRFDQADTAGGEGVTL